MNLKKIIKEEIDDLQWIKDANPHLPKDTEDLKNFIGWSFIWDPSHEKSGRWGYQGRSWEIVEIFEKDGFPWIKWENKEFNESNSDTTHEFLKRINEGVWVLISPEGVLLDPLYNREWNGYQGPRITESDDLEWIKNTGVRGGPADLVMGERIRVHNMGSEEGYETWLGIHVDDYKEGLYGEYITGTIVYYHEKDNPRLFSFEIKEENTGNTIYFPGHERIKNHRTQDMYPGLELFYEKL
jgi:hypothetical protein